MTRQPGRDGRPTSSGSVMRHLIRLRALSVVDCERLSRDFLAQRGAYSARQLAGYVADGLQGQRTTLLAEVQTHIQIAAGLASASYGNAGGWEASPRFARLTDLFVVPRLHGNGVGALLIEALQAEIVRVADGWVVDPERLPNDDLPSGWFESHGYSKTHEPATRWVKAFQGGNA